MRRNNTLILSILVAAAGVGLAFLSLNTTGQPFGLYHSLAALSAGAAIVILSISLYLFAPHLFTLSVRGVEIQFSDATRRVDEALDAYAAETSFANLMRVN